MSAGFNDILLKTKYKGSSWHVQTQLLILQTAYANDLCLFLISRGVPQRSVFGPFLFLICIKDLQEYVLMHADDTSVMLSPAEDPAALEEKLKIDIDEVQ